MERKMDSSVPFKLCQYGNDCYCVHPHHFQEYSHPHIETLLSKVTSINQVAVPEQLKINKSVFEEQIRIVAKQFPHLADCVKYPANQTKVVDTATASSKQASSETKPSPATSIERKNAIENLFVEQTEEITENEATNSVPVSEPNTRTASFTEYVDVEILLGPGGSLPPYIDDFFPVLAPRGRMAQKLAAAEPYNFFLTTITDSKPTHSEPLSVTFQELLDSSLGQLESSVQISFLVDIEWLLAHYYFAGYENLPLLILYGDETPEPTMELMKKPNLTTIMVEIKTPVGVHHTKMGLYGYRDGSMRIVISTANLYKSDWHNRAQGLWISPRLPAVPEDADTSFGESVTDFRSDLLAYLDAYKLPQLHPWIARIRRTDFSAVKVCLVASVPGGHVNTRNGPLWGHARLGYLLKKYAAPIDDSCPLVAQSSSIGSFGPSPHSWILGEIMANFGKSSTPPGTRRVPGFCMIYPSYSNVEQSHNALRGGGGLPYGRDMHSKQEWPNAYLYQWCSRSRNRNKAMPHMKTYCRCCDQGLYWFLLTSANLSKSAWGRYYKPRDDTINRGRTLNILSFEAGVLFLPKLLLDENFFPMEANQKHPPFPMPYDVPIIPYAPEDTPFFIDYLREPAT
ncbi:probable tyrosyl-DNA phosphodiesterase isoform X2 [Anopheles albimanus]|uniref:probable tyrosyl-DNA phosphodiesterase isoform X2 n=1 Tax=Anopheles albimanus TaxID=7167 RepID=UPI00163E0DA3|nr:probable tyrosyl-DNA phosphodiesterase isoform X2 [Anopheles albimanus]